MGNIIAAGFNAGSDDGEIESLAQDLRALAEIGAERSRSHRPRSI